MNKVLTISIAAYNVGSYIRATLDSLIVPDVLDKLEVFIIDDGGKDDTLAIAQEYADKYPNVFFPVHKENGGYGSTVMWSVEHASGKYFKLLDGDDWFTTENISEYVKRMENSNADAFLSNTAKAVEGKEKHEMYAFTHELDGKTVDIKDAVEYPVVAMWAYAFKTSVVKENFRPLPLHTLYTDQIYVMYSLCGVKNIEYFGGVIYNWRLGRDEQSNSVNSIRKHYCEIIDVANIINEFFTEKKNSGLSNGLAYMLKRAAAYYSNSIAMLLQLEKTSENKEIIINWEKMTKEKYRDIYDAAAAAKKLLLLRKSGYLSYKFI